MTSAISGPAEGELFGYRLGAKYPVGEMTRGYVTLFSGSVTVMAEKPEMSSEFERLELITTPKTFMIGNIYAVAEFVDEEKAKEFTSGYADLLQTLHNSRCSPLKASSGESLKLLCGGSFVLSVQRFEPHRPSERHQVHVGLRTNNESKVGKRWTAQLRSELTQLESDEKKARLEQALKEQKLKGLQ